ncbi:MAG: MYXO-CTERM sorting domain-containing protein [Myxococcota bacterium]
MTFGRVIAWALPASLLLPVAAQAGGVITHGDSGPDGEVWVEHCGRECEDLKLLVDEVFYGRDANIARLADAEGLEVTLDLLDRPRDFDLDTRGESGGCAATGPGFLAALGAAVLLRRRRKPPRPEPV